MNKTNKSDKAGSAGELGDESFMSAEELRAYMTDMQMAKASKSLEGMDQAEKARQELVKRLSDPIELTPERLAEIAQNLKSKVRAAVKRDETELMVMRFPVALCTDKGRAINNAESDWPDTLTGRPRQAYEFWRDKLKPAARAQRDNRRMARRPARRRRVLPQVGAESQDISGPDPPGIPF